MGKAADPEPTGLAITADLNGDGYPDVVTGTHVYLNPGNGDFHNVIGQRYWNATAMGATVTVIAGVDVDSDGDIDLVVATDDPTGAKVLINPGSSPAWSKQATTTCANGMPARLLGAALWVQEGCSRPLGLDRGRGGALELPTHC